jgi:hypothetical protein
MNSAYRKLLREEQKKREQKFFLFWTLLNLAVGLLAVGWVWAFK